MFRLHLRPTLALLVLLAALPAIDGHAIGQEDASAQSPGTLSITVEPAEAELVGPLARVQLAVTSARPPALEHPEVSPTPPLQAGEQGSDLTRAVRYESLLPEVAAVSETGEVRPLADGTAVVRVSYESQAIDVPVRVRGIGSTGETPVPLPQVAVSFTEDVIPILSKAGCNQGACHGAQYGQGDFKLSLLGYAPEQDYPEIVRDWMQRRIALARPQDSLLLRKPTGEVPHGGGRRFAVGSYEYEVLRAWIAAGAPGPRPDEPGVVDLAVTPGERVYEVGQSQQLRVVAHYADGTTRDVTNRALYDSLSDAVAAVTPSGYVTTVGPGQTAVMVRYQGQAIVSMVVVPYADHVDLAGFQPNNFIDEHVMARWRRLGLQPSGLCSDAEFIRRAFLDSIGTLPPPQRVQAFLASDDPNKRAALVDELLGLTGDPARDVWVNEYSAYWALKWGDLLRNNRNEVGDGGMWALYNWIRGALRESMPMDQFVREIITAEGSIYQNGPANYYRIARTPEDLAETTVQVFLGVRLQCARCHHHPFEVYSQGDYYGLAAFFTSVTTKSSSDFGALGADQVVMVTDPRPIRHPRTGEVMQPTPLLGDPLDTAGVRDPRRALADWISAPENRPFARNLVNRIWGYFMGTGLVEPIDDMRATNPPSNPELLDALADDFVAGGYDLRRLMRAIMTSRVYQLSSTPPSPQPSPPAGGRGQGEGGPSAQGDSPVDGAPGAVDPPRFPAADTRFYTHYNVRRLPAEVLLDAIDFACGTQERFPGIPLGTRAIELPDPNYASYFLDTLGRPQRVITCECERTAEPNLAQVLSIANGEVLNRKLADGNGRVAQLAASERSNSDVVTELYLCTLSRPPTADEIAVCEQVIGTAPNRREGLEDVLWALCNSREFLFNH